MHRAGRMMCRQIERLEVMVVIFNLRAFHHLVADAAKEPFHTLQDQGHRMQATNLSMATR